MKLEIIKRHLFTIDPFKTIYFNLKSFNFKTAIKFPVLINWGVKLISIKANIKIDAPISTGLIIIGRSCSLDLNGNVFFKGKARLGKRSHFYVGSYGTLTFGNDFWLTSDVEINCAKNITFGDNCLLSWDIEVLDTDFHKIKENGMIINQDTGIVLGDRVWVGCKTTILKGSVVASDIIIGAASLINKTCDESFCIYAGSPAKVVKRNVTWEP